MYYPSIHYDEPLYRPPSEANSAILQATIGCSWNSCAFCEMYTSKRFRVRSFDDIASDIASLASFYQGVRKVFLADGNAFVLSPAKLIPILEEINLRFGRLQRISSYATPRDILAKSDNELQTLRNLGLRLLYIGIESGDDELLALLNKGETYATTVEGISRAHAAGIDTSVMVITGAGGRVYSQQHALNSACVVNAVSPKYLSTLTLSLPYGADRFRTKFKGIYQPQTLREQLVEIQTFIEHLNLNSTIFRSNHVSNSLVLNGTLPKDKDAFLDVLDEAIASIGN